MVERDMQEYIQNLLKITDRIKKNNGEILFFKIYEENGRRKVAVKRNPRLSVYYGG